MVMVPNFKLLAKGQDITAKIKANLISLSYEDKEGEQSDEISFSLNGIYAKPLFGDELELWLGYSQLYLCGRFAVQTTAIDYKAKTTEVRATAVNFASPIKVAKQRTWQETTLFNIAKEIARANNLNSALKGEDYPVLSALQDNVSDLDFLYSLSFDLGYLMKVANGAIIIAAKDAKGDDTQTSNMPKNEALPCFELSLAECFELSITEANRNSYTAVIVQWHDSTDGKDKQIKVGSGEQVHKLEIAEPKSDNEAFKRGEAKLNELQKGWRQWLA